MVQGLCDTHCHLDLEPLKSYLPFVLKSSSAQGVNKFIVPGVTKDAWSSIQSLACSHPEVFYALGLHPAVIDQHCVSDLNELSERIRADSNKCVAVGEIGLDRRYANEGQQERLFCLQLELARDLGKPVIIHSVGRHQRVLDLLKTVPGVHGVIHAFSGSAEQANQYVGLGFMLGAGSLVLRSKKTRDAFKSVPLSVILLETDSPDMFLPTSSSRCGSPLDLLVILQELAAIHGLAVDEAARAFQENCEKLFFLSK